MAKGRGGSSSSSSNKKKKANRPRGNPYAALDLSGEFPEEWVEQNRKPAAAAEKQQRSRFSAMYARYKKATYRFKEALMVKVPSEIFGDGGTESLMDSVEYLANDDRAGPLELSFMQDLTLTLRVRKKVQAVMGGGDEGHAHFILVLEYCWATLATKWMQQQEDASPSGGQSKEKEETFENRFSALSIEEDIDGEEEEKEVFPAEDVPRPKTDKAELQNLTVDEIFNADDRVAATMFLRGVDEIGTNVQLAYRRMKKVWQETKENNKKGKSTDHVSIVEELLRLAVASNFAIQEVTRMEKQMALDHPHLNTVYKFIAIMIMPTIMEDITKQVLKHSKIADQFDPRKDTVEFLGTCLETSFRIAPDVPKNTVELAAGFCKKWQMEPNSFIGSVVVNCVCLPKFEVPIFREEEIFDQLSNHIGGQEPESNKWFDGFPFQGNDQNILRTIRLLQLLENFPTKGKQFGIFRNDLFGPEWNEHEGKATKIRNDMDDFLIRHLVTPLTALCRAGVVSKDVPLLYEIFPLFCNIKDWIKDYKQPVTFANAFGFHLILASVFELQGDDDVYMIGRIAEYTFHNYFRQLESCTAPNTEQWRKNHEFALRLKLLIKTPFEVDEEKGINQLQLTHSMWNPVCAGSFLLYICYFINLNGGISMIDSMSQIRVVLHLYNALLLIKAVEPGEIEFLDYYYNLFFPSKSFWGGLEYPKRGELTRQWCVSSGNSIQVSQYYSDGIKTKLMGNDEDKINIKRTSTKRIISQAKAQDFSKSYRRVAQRDFSDVVDHILTEERRKEVKSQNEERYYYGLRCNDTIKAMVEDKRFLATNVIKLGDFLNEFIIELFKEPEWKLDDLTETEQLMLEPSKLRNHQTTVFVERILGVIDFVDSPESDPVITKTAEFTKNFFTPENTKKVMWYTPSENKPIANPKTEEETSKSKEEEESEPKEEEEGGVLKET